MKPLARLLILVTVLGLGACSKTDTKAIDERVAALEAQIAAQEERIDAAYEVMSGLNDVKVDKIELSDHVEAWNLPAQRALLQPVSSGYSVIRHDHGLMAVSFRDATPVASGTRLKLSLVNMMAVGLNDVSLDIRYTTGTPDSLGSLSTIEGGAREIKKGLVEPLPPGTETIVTVDLPGIPPDKLTYLVVKPTIKAMRYR